MHLFAPRQATRVRWNTNTDTPLPPDEPTGLNPPDGATIDYWLKSPAAGPVVLEILDAKGDLVRRYSSADRREPPRDDGNVPRYWIRPAQVPSAEAGLHRLVWDLHYAPPAAQESGYPISATPLNTPKEPRGPWALPGRYTVQLRAGSQTRTQPLDVRMDPRVKTPPGALREQFALSVQLSGAIGEVSAGLDELRARRKAGSTAVVDRQLAELEGSSAGGRRRHGAKADPAPFREVAAQLSELFQLVQAADAAPTPQTKRAAMRLLGVLMATQRLRIFAAKEKEERAMAENKGTESNRGTAAMDEEKRREIASKGGHSVPNEKRSFSRNPELASEAGRKGGESVPPEKRPFAQHPELASEAGRKGGKSVPPEKRPFARNPELASEAGRKGGESRGGSKDE